METRRVHAKLNGTRLWYETRGTGEALVLLHGTAVDARMWDDQVETFARRYTVVRYDLRGFGKSSVPDGTPYSHADDLMALLNHLEISNVSVFGHSLGGRVAIDFALTYPDAVNALVLVGCSPSGWTPPQEFSALERVPYDAASESGLDAAREACINSPLLKIASGNAETASRLGVMVSEYSGWHWTNSDPVLHAAPPAMDRLGEIGAPTLIIIGEHAATDLHMVADRMQHRIPNARKIVMLNSGSFPNIEAPERFNRTMLGFLSG